MSEYYLIKIGSESRADFIVAWEQSFSRILDDSIYDWIFNDQNILYALVYDGKIAAGYCLYPLKCIWKASESVALLCNNVFVCPDHQGKHLFVKISKAALRDASAQGYGNVAYGVPNALALPGHKRVGWGVQEPIHFLEKTDLNSQIIKKHDWVYGSLTGEQRESIAKCSHSASKGRAFSVLKNEIFLKWRYESKPGVKYWFGLAKGSDGVLAYCVCKYYPERNILHFVDIDGTCEKSTEELLVEAEGICEEFEKINVWSSTAKKDAFLKNGYFCSEEFNNFIVKDMEAVEPPYLRNNFNLCLGDNDVF